MSSHCSPVKSSPMLSLRLQKQSEFLSLTTEIAVCLPGFISLLLSTFLTLLTSCNHLNVNNPNSLLHWALSIWGTFWNVPFCILTLTSSFQLAFYSSVTFSGAFSDHTIWKDASQVPLPHTVFYHFILLTNCPLIDLFVGVPSLEFDLHRGTDFC